MKYSSIALTSCDIIGLFHHSIIIWY